MTINISWLLSRQTITKLTHHILIEYGLGRLRHKILCNIKIRRRFQISEAQLRQVLGRHLHTPLIMILLVFLVRVVLGAIFMTLLLLTVMH